MSSAIRALRAQGQRYNASGSAIGGEFQINTYTTNSQYRPSVASDSSGNFVVVWESDGSAGSDTSGALRAGPALPARALVRTEPRRDARDGGRARAAATNTLPARWGSLECGQTVRI
jgi:hypothetical protein